jgi:hypothetical protein
VSASRKDPNILVAKIIANIAKQNSQINYAIDLGAGQIARGQLFFYRISHDLFIGSMNEFIGRIRSPQ